MARRRAHTRTGPDGKVVHVREHDVASIASTPDMSAAPDTAARGWSDADPVERGPGLDIVAVAPGVVRGDDLSGCDFRRLNTFGEATRFVDADLSRSNMEGTAAGGVYYRCSFEELQATFSDHSRAVHMGSSFLNATLSMSIPPQAADRCSFEGADLTMAQARYAVYNECTFGRAKLNNAYLQACEFRGCDLSGAEGLDEATFVDCRYDDGTVFPDGYEPASNGWRRVEDKSGDHQRLVARYRDAES